jgi:hypothetical protein
MRESILHSTGFVWCCAIRWSAGVLEQNDVTGPSSNSVEPFALIRPLVTTVTSTVIVTLDYYDSYGYHCYYWLLWLLGLEKNGIIIIININHFISFNRCKITNI